MKKLVSLIILILGLLPVHVSAQFNENEEKVFSESENIHILLIIDKAINVNKPIEASFRIYDQSENSIENTLVKVYGKMPAHGHGLSSKPKVFFDDGRYLIKGLKLNMPGQWIINLHVYVKGQLEIINYEIEL